MDKSTAHMHRGQILSPKTLGQKRPCLHSYIVAVYYTYLPLNGVGPFMSFAKRRLAVHHHEIKKTDMEVVDGVYNGIYNIRLFRSVIRLSVRISFAG